MSRMALRTEALRLRPAGAAEPVEHRLDALDARVLLHEVEALDRQQERSSASAYSISMNSRSSPSTGNALQAA